MQMREVLEHLNKPRLVAAGKGAAAGVSLAVVRSFLEIPIGQRFDDTSFGFLTAGLGALTNWLAADILSVYEQEQGSILGTVTSFFTNPNEAMGRGTMLTAGMFFLRPFITNTQNSFTITLQLAPLILGLVSSATQLAINGDDGQDDLHEDQFFDLGIMMGTPAA